MHNYLLVSLYLLTIQFAFGQKENTVSWGKDISAWMDPIAPDSSGMNSTSWQFGEHFYVILQFKHIPDAKLQRRLQTQGILRVGYLQENAYLAIVPKHIDWAEVPNLERVLVYPASMKLAAALSNNNYPPHAISEKGQILLNIYPFQTVAPSVLGAEIANLGAKLMAIQEGQLQVEATEDQLLKIAKIPAVFYIETIAEAPVHEGYVGRNQQRTHWLGKGPADGLDGEGIVMAIGDDGSVDHLDFANRVFDHTRFERGVHGDMTVGLAIGAGNLDPRAIGMAPAATLHLYNIEQYEHINQAVTNYQELGTVITSTSFWEGCGGAYTQAARSIDLQVNQSISLLHCFSAGNQGNANCNNPYGELVKADGTRFGNITGGRKAAKHVIAVANLSAQDTLINDSSRGPAADGRIKPDLAAPGSGQLSTDRENAYQLASGTSAASPTVAGAAALLYEAYRESHGGVDPPLALIKAILLNTADDLGRRGPDFEYGWGRPHLGRALSSLREQPILAAAVQHQEQKAFAIDVPAGIQRMKVMMYWNDPAALPFNERALVNDLDLSIQSPSGAIHLPWTLSSYPHLDSLTRPAIKGKDRLNNMEQVEIEVTESGTYKIDVEGYQVPAGPQTFFITVLFDEGSLAWAYPFEGQGFVPGELETLRWEGRTDAGGNIAIDYSQDSMQTWVSIADNISAECFQYDWEVPTDLSGVIYLRLKPRHSAPIISKPVHTLAWPRLAMVPRGDEGMMMYWDPIPSADQYQIYRMGYRYMEKIALTQDTFLFLPTFVGKEEWYSIAGVHKDGVEGLRSPALHYEHYSCDFQLSLNFIFDQFPAENRWQIQSPDGQIWASGGPYPNHLGNTAKQIPLCLPLGCYELVVMDAFQDGMCCLQGQGQFALLVENERILVEGGEFEAQVSLPFCLDEMLLPQLNAQLMVIQAPSCHEGEDGALRVEMEAGTSHDTRYQWNTGDTCAQIAGLKEGEYRVTVSQENESLVLSTFLKGPDPLDVELHGSSPLCQGEATGWLDIMVLGGTAPYSYALNGQIDWGELELDQLEAGVYSLTVSDANGCLSITNTVLSDPDSISADINLWQDDGRGYRRLTANALGGLAPYQYTWSNGEVGASIADPAAETYSLSIVDANACTISMDVSVPAPVEVCHSSAKSAHYEWIDRVRIDSLAFFSGNNDGYADFTDRSVSLQAGRGYQISIQPGFDGIPFNEYFRVWVDFNRDFDFTDPGEEIISLDMWSGVVEAQLFIGTVISSGPLRMRVAMQYGAPPTSCGELSFGEVEDYLIEVENPIYNPLYSTTYFSLGAEKLRVFPNPVSDGVLRADLDLLSGEFATILLFDRIGRILIRRKRKGRIGKNELKLDVGDLETGMYWMLMLDKNGMLTESRAIHIKNDRGIGVQLDD